MVRLSCAVADMLRQITIVNTARRFQSAGRVLLNSVRHFESVRLFITVRCFESGRPVLHRRLCRRLPRPDTQRTKPSIGARNDGPFLLHEIQNVPPPLAGCRKMILNRISAAQVSDTTSDATTNESRLPKKNNLII